MKYINLKKNSEAAPALAPSTKPWRRMTSGGKEMGSLVFPNALLGKIPETSN